MPSIERIDSAASSISTLLKHAKASHCIVQYRDIEKSRKIINIDKILNPSNRRLKAGDDCTLKSEGRHHTRVKILFMSDLESCQHQMCIIGDTEVENGMELTEISSENDLIDENRRNLSEELKKKKVNSGVTKLTTNKLSMSQNKNDKTLHVSKSSEKSTGITRQKNNKENLKSKEKDTSKMTTDNDLNCLKKQARIVSSQYRNAQPISAQKPFSTQNKPNRALTPLSSDQSCNELSSTRNSEDHSKNIEASNRSPTQRTREHDKVSKVTTDPDPDADADADTDTDTDTKQIDDKQNNDPLVIKYNRLVEKCNRLKNRINKLENENEILKKKTMPLPPPEVQQWFKYTAQRFENKLLSGSVLKDFSGALGMPSNVLISLTQDTGSLTARAIVRYLYPSKTRVLSDIENKTREAILNYVKFCHPNEVFVRGKINEAISGPFRTATFKTRPEDENRSVTNIYDDVKTSSDLEINSQEDTEDDSEWIDEKKSETQYDERIAYEQMSSLKRNLTKKEIATALIILKVRHRLTTMAISDICRLLRLLDVPNAPKSFSAVKRLIEQEATDKIKPDVLNICHSCNSVFKRTCDNQKCQSNSQQIRSPNFLKFLLKDQIQLILESENNFTLYSQLPSLSNDHIAEIQHADWYRSVAENEDGSNFITLLLNVDGIAMSGSSDNSLWIFT
ncbi:unnamed protein product, partial [Rotaria magnacalcarata]